MFRQASGTFIQTSGLGLGVNLGDGFPGMPEELLGRWPNLRRVERGEVVIATRLALTRPGTGGLATYTELIRQCAADSIRRSGCDYLDFLAVEWTNEVAPVAGSMTALEAVVASGDVRYVAPANACDSRFSSAVVPRSNIEFASPTEHGCRWKTGSLQARTPPEISLPSRVSSTARCSDASTTGMFSFSDDAHLGALCHSPSSN